MSSRLGYFLMNKASGGRNWSADEVAYRNAHLKRLNPGAMLFLDDDGEGLQTKALLPDCAVVGRKWRADEGDLWKTFTPRQCLDLYKDTPKGIIRNVLNEPLVDVNDFSRFATWCAEVMDLFGNAGIPIALPNWGEGNPALDHFDLLEPLWKAFDKWHDLHSYTTHEYGSHYGLLFNQSTNHDMYPWRIGRFERFTVPYLQEHGHKIPNVIVTEFGCDSAHDGTAFRGWKTCWNETQYFAEIKAAIEAVYNKPYYKGLCMFSWGNTGQPNTESDWITFDVSEAKGLHQSLETLNTAPQPPSAPFDYGALLKAQINLLTPNIDFVYLRPMPSTDNSPLIQVRDGDEVEWSVNGNIIGQYSWHQVNHKPSGKSGFMAKTDKFEVIPITIPIPPILPPETSKKAILDTIAAMENNLIGIIGEAEDMHITLQKLRAQVDGTTTS